MKFWFVIASLVVLLGLAGCTAPPPNTAAPAFSGPRLFSFAVFGDNGNLNDHFKEIVKDIGRQNASLVVGVGDYSEGKNARELQSFKNYLDENLSLPYYLAVGDNDRMLNSSGVRTTDDFERVLETTRNQRFEFLGHYFLILDSSDESVGYRPSDLEWLERELRPLSDKGVFIFTHVPPQAPLLQAFDSRAEGRADSENSFIRLCAQYGVDQIFSGHFHGHLSYTVGEAENPIPVEVSGGAGSAPQFGQDADYHYLLVTVYEEGYQIEIKSVN